MLETKSYWSCLYSFYIRFYINNFF